VRLRKESIESSQDACKQRLQQRQKRLEQLHRELRDKTNGANKSTLQLYKDRWNECVRQTEKMVADAQHDRELFLLSTALMPGNRWESIGDQSDSIRNQLLRAMELSRKMEQNSKTNDTARTIGYEHVLTVLISMGLSFQSYLILKGLMPPAGALFSAVAVFIGLVITSIAYMSYRKRKLDTSEWARGTGERTERDWCCQELSDCLGGDAPGFARFAESGSESAVQQAFAGFGKWNDAVERCLSQRRVQESLLSEIRDVLSKPNCQPSECVWFLNAQIGEQEKAESILREIEIEEHSKAQEEQTAIEFENQLDLLRPHLETYQSFFQLAGNGNSEESFDLLQNHRESAILQKELSKQWNILSQAVRESAESMDSETLESLRKQFIQQVAEAEAGVLSSGEQLGRLRQEQLILLGEETPEELKGVIDALEQERKDQLFRRDRLTVAAALTRMAEERFRASNQPQVVIKTVEILKKLCPDRERPLWLEPDGLYIEPSKGYTVPVDTFAFSTGFRHQIYFALRLALTNRLSKSDEALPIILDEPFAHWDSERTKFGFQVLNELAQKHQIFFFTCRPELLTLATDLPNIGRFYLD